MELLPKVSGGHVSVTFKVLVAVLAFLWSGNAQRGVESESEGLLRLGKISKVIERPNVDQLRLV